MVYSFSVSPSDLSDYSVTLDSVLYPLAVPQPSDFGWRAQSGVLQRQNGFGTWETYTGTMNQFFDDYGIATLADVSAVALTKADIVDSLYSYFGSTTILRYGSGLNGVTYVAHTLSDLIGTQLQDVSRSLYLPQGRYMLYADGTYRQTPGAYTIVDMVYNAVTALYQALTGSLNGFSTSFVTYNGYYDTVSGVLPGIAYLNDNLFRWLAESGSTDILGADGQVLSYSSPNLEVETRNGFLGLANLLRGVSTADGVPMTFVDYTTGEQLPSFYSASLFDLNASGFEGIQNLLALYLFSHGTDLDIKERENMQEQANTFVDEFTDPSGGGTPSVGNILDTAGVSAGIKDAFSSSATAADAFNQLNSEENFSFFSSEVQNSLNPFYSTSTYSLTDDDFVDYVSPKLQEIFGGLGSSW